MLGPATARGRPRRRPSSADPPTRRRGAGRAASMARHALAAQPWQSPSVAALVRQATSKAPNDAQPMLVEGPRGTALRAVGSAADHAAAGDALGQCIADRKKRAVDGVEMMLPPPLTAHVESKRLRPVAEYEDALPALSKGAARRESDLVFGAVLEYCDAFGKPRILNSTAMLPEQQYLEDGRDHPKVSRLLTAGRGSSSVVWAGVGRRSAGVGEGEMAVIREAVVDSRAERLRISRLRGVKPYSAHGW